ncbi:MAG: hypothetical protein IKY92_00120, partial [Akkermansia sp.]|nr:hypothetical protein [Akkermansia sp.]
MGAGSALADEEFLRYWWVSPDAPAEKSPRVIRVLGEKGERYEEVYAAETRAELKSEPAILRARLARQTALRKEAVELARQLRESGKSPIVAYEEAWTRVFAENRLAAVGLTLSCWLEDTLARLTAGQQLTEDEKQLILEALLADEDSLEGEAGQELLRRLAEQLRGLGYGLFDTPSLNDELMQRFAEALRYMKPGVAAFRDALFKTHRDRVMYHTLNGYQAPWGAGMGRNLHYHQTPKQVGITEFSGNTQPLQTPGEKPQFTAPGLNDLPGSITDFLATSPPAKGEKAEEENDEEKEDEYQEQEEQVTSSLPPLLSTFSLRAVNPVPVVVTEDETQGDSGSGREGVLRWDSTAGEPAVWDTEQTTAWVDGNGAETPYTAGGSVEFGNGADLNKSVQVADAGVVAGTVAITGSGYHFTGGNIKVTESLTVTGTAGFDRTLDVGANRIQGGTLENVQMQITGEIERPVTQDTVTAHNLITSADGTHAAVLTDVVLYAGTATEYATLHNVAFDGESTLTGYITFEKTQTTEKFISVVAGGKLTLNDLTLDLRGLAMGEDKRIVVNAGGSLYGWSDEAVHFVYSGVTINSAAVKVFKKDADGNIVSGDMGGGDGYITLETTHGGNLYWNGTADDKWNISSEVWSASEERQKNEVFTALSNVYFDKGDACQEISVIQDMVVADFHVREGNYSFNGARIAALGNANFSSGALGLTFNNQLVVQGGLTTSGPGSIDFNGNVTVAKSAELKNATITIGGDMTVVGSLEVNADSLNISGDVSAAQMNITVNGTKSTVSGNLTSTGKITINGTAEQHYMGAVKTQDLIVDPGKKEVYFSHLHVDRLTVGEGASVHVLTASDSVAVSSSEFRDIYLSGTLALDSYGTTYNNGYNVHVQGNNAQLYFGKGTTIDSMTIDGKTTDDSGNVHYHNLVMTVESSNATVNSMRNLGDLTVKTGSLTVKDAESAVHGKLVLDNGKLKLESDNIMAADSGKIQLKNGGRLDIGSTTQTLYARNEAES